jgi:DNA-binding MarR family transcriptional regulator
MTTFKDVYQKYVNLTIDSEKSTDMPSIDPVEKRLLDLLSRAWSSDQKVTVVETMNITQELSTSTIFRYLKKLRQKGYIELIVDEIDNRVKYVSPTKQCDKYFSRLGKYISESAKLM